MKRKGGKPFDALMEEHGCTAEERRACLEYLAFLRFRRLLRQQDGLRFLLLVLAEDLR